MEPLTGGSTQYGHGNGGKQCVGSGPAPTLSGPDDNWKHRSARMRCGTCMWFIEKETTRLSDGTLLIGRCRRHAPTTSGFPVVFAGDWCGDHKLSEERL